MVSGVHHHYSQWQRAWILETVKGLSPGSYIYLLSDLGLLLSSVSSSPNWVPLVPVHST